MPRSAFSMQAASVSASLRQGMTMVSSTLVDIILAPSRQARPGEKSRRAHGIPAHREMPIRRSAAGALFGRDGSHEPGVHLGEPLRERFLHLTLKGVGADEQPV